MTSPLKKTPVAPYSTPAPLDRLDHVLNRWVAFLIVPLFGFANAGVDLGGLTAEQIFARLPLGIAIGLFLGKQIGIFGRVWLEVRPIGMESCGERVGQYVWNVEGGD